MSTHNIGFYEEISKIITYHQISSNTHLISSAGPVSYSNWQNSQRRVYSNSVFYYKIDGYVSG